MKKRLFPALAVLALVLVAVVLLRGESKKAAPSAAPGPRLPKVGIAVLMTHPALDTVIREMKSELAARGYREGESVEYLLKNANGDVNLSSPMVRELELKGADVIVAITTPVAQAAVKATTRPIVFSAVTDPIGSGVVSSLETPGPNITGVSDAWPYSEQLHLAREILPNAKKLGVVFNPGETSSQYGIKQIRALAPGLGFEIIELVVSNSTEIYGALSTSIRNLDAVYLSSDNTVIQGLPAALKVSLDAKKALFVGDSGTVEKGGLAAVSVGYEGVGKATGERVARFLKGERGLPVVVAHGDEIFLNLDTARRIGLAIPEAVRTRATKVYGGP